MEERKKGRIEERKRIKRKEVGVSSVKIVLTKLRFIPAESSYLKLLECFLNPLP